MILKQKELSDQIQLAAKELHAEEAWLFGSYACNEAREDSDVDVLFILESELPRPKRIAQNQWGQTPSIVDLITFKQINGNLL